METKPVKLSAVELAGRAARIRALEELRRRSSRRECEVIARIGRELTATKKGMAHGKWLPWVKNNLPFDQATANRYMKLATNYALLRNLLPLGKTVVYELMELPAEALAGLTPDSTFKVAGRKRRLSDLDCHEVALFVAELKGGPVPQPSLLTRTMGQITALARTRKEDPAVWGQVADDVAALLSNPCPPCPPTKTTLDGATRNERAAEVRQRLVEVRALLGQVDDVAGRLSQTVKLELMVQTNAFWREANALTAFAEPSSSGGTARAMSTMI